MYNNVCVCCVTGCYTNNCQVFTTDIDTHIEIVASFIEQRVDK